jgi:PKD repeat protein
VLTSKSRNMKKLLLLLACSIFIFAQAQNKTQINLNSQASSKQTVRQLAFQKSPILKKKQERTKLARKNGFNATTKSGGNRTGCFSYSSDPFYTYFSADNYDSSIVAWVWDYNDGSTDTNYYAGASHYFNTQNNNGYEWVCLTVIDSLGGTQTCCDSVYMLDSSSFCYSNFSIMSIDSNHNVMFMDDSYAFDSIISWAWDFGDNTGATIANPTHQYSAEGVYNVCLTIITANGCSNTYCYAINVNETSSSCQAYFNYTSAFNTFYFNDFSSTNSGNVIDWAWDFGDNNTSTMTSPTYTYSMPGLYTACLTITTDSGCTATWCEYVNFSVNSNLTVDTIANLEQTLSTLLFGSCVSVSNLTYTGASSAVGYFLDPSAEIDSSFSYGLLLTTGDVQNAVGPNNSTSQGTNNSLPGDADLDALVPGYTTYDASIIEFDFTSASDTIIASDIVFASEEYPEFVGTTFNDVFGFYISGPGITGTTNLALIPNTSDPISVNSVNQNLNTPYYIDNSNGTTYQYDGRTTVISLKQAITPGQTYHFKIAIADAGDGIYDSGVLIKAGSFNGNAQIPVAAFTATETANLTVNFTNTSVNSNIYGWDFGDGNTSTLPNPTHTYAAPGQYTVTLLSSNVCYSDTATFVINVGTNGINTMNAENSLLVVPTANNGVYNLLFNASANEKVEVKVFNVNGQVVIDNAYTNAIGQNSHSIDLSAYANGLYTIQLNTPKQVFTSRVIR